jgi:hypothetical protein
MAGLMVLVPFVITLRTLPIFSSPVRWRNLPGVVFGSLWEWTGTLLALLIYLPSFNVTKGVENGYYGFYLQPRAGRSGLREISSLLKLNSLHGRLTLFSKRIFSCRCKGPCKIQKFFLAGRGGQILNIVSSLYAILADCFQI